MKYYLILLFLLNSCSNAPSSNNKYSTETIFYLHPDMFTDRKVSATTKYTSDNGNSISLLWQGLAYGDQIEYNPKNPIFKIYYNHSIISIYGDTRISYMDKTKEISYEVPLYKKKYTLKIHNHKVIDIRVETILDPIPPNTIGKLNFDMFKHEQKLLYYYIKPGPSRPPFFGGEKTCVISANTARIINISGDLITISYNFIPKDIIVDSSISYNPPNDIIQYTVSQEGILQAYKITIVDNKVTQFDTR